MTAIQLSAAIACVAAIAAGQLLFKAVGLALAEAATVLHPKVLLLGASAIALYFAATLAWIWLLQYVSLARAYPYMALSFVLVPAFSALLFGDRISVQYLAGMAFVLVGLLTITLDRG